MGASRFSLLFCLSLLFLPRFSIGQQTQVYLGPDVEFRKGLDLFEKQKYAEAQEVFDRFSHSAPDKKNLQVIDANYYAALCAVELFHKDAELRLKQFLADHPESPKCQRVRYQLGRYNYRRKRYDDVLAWFRQVQIYDLQGEEISEYYFKRGYAHFELGHTDSAKTDFFEIKDLASKYAPPATYYYSHISYTHGNYETALQGFQKLSADETFGPVIPFYIAQIYFLQGRYNDVISYAPPLLDSAKRADEIAHLIGASWYRTGRYKNAIPFLEQYHAGTRKFTRADAYELGYAYYKADSCASAIRFFQDAIADSTDALAQNSWYHLADCYVKTGNKLAARGSFGQASSMKFDPVVREDALFNYARLSYELSFNPFNEAIVALDQYLFEFPNTPRRDEAYTLLTNVYLASKNYKNALVSLEHIKSLPPTMFGTYQQVAYNQGIILYKSGDYDNAIIHFDKSQQYPVSRELNANANYWKGGCWYAKADKSDTIAYAKAIEAYKAFLFTPGASVMNNYNTANYNIGYCYYQQAQISRGTSIEIPAAAKTAYANSMIWFRKYIANKSEVDADERIFDAYVRMGDGYFRLRDFINSAEFYGKAVAQPSTDQRDKDYAMFQQAMALGFLGKSQEKADLLKKLRETYGQSGILATAQYQEARTLHDMRNYDAALEAYNRVYTQFPKSEYQLACLKNMALIYQAKKDYDNALLNYKKAVPLAKAGGTNEFKDIMAEIKSIYIGKGALESWESFAAEQGFSEPVAVADSTAWVVADRAYRAGNCSEVLNQAGKYLLKYPAGIYITDIQFMRAECAGKSNDHAGALSGYLAVLEKGQTRYRERALIKVSLIYYKQKDYVNAATYFGQLEREGSTAELKNNARVNLMNSWMNLGNADSAAFYAEKVIAIKNLANEIYGTAYYHLGKSALAKGNKTEAAKNFKEAETKLPQSEIAAESRFHQCQIIFDNKDYKGAEKALLKQINDFAGFSNWSGKGLLLLADNYLAKATAQDTFQARAILKNYIENG
ncbi:MAG TPA: tetratricopeptide repeat protein, partial [Bacteroidia bacterium]|nr:tetratricopeptide repeat protein [Bacteroidia bacterium]